MKYGFVIGFLAIAIQAQSIQQFVGTVSGFKPIAAEIEIKPDAGVAVPAKIVPSSVIQKIAPGEKDLKNAQSISFADVAIGDRVLVAIEPGSGDLRRLVVMSSADIRKRDEADRQDWTERGISGLVAAKDASHITLKVRTIQGSDEVVALVNERTAYKRYAPDSVKFADAKPSLLSELKLGDQVRVRGTKSDDGKKIEAQDVVFGTFQSRVGSLVSVDSASSTLTVRELGTGKTLAVRLTADSRLKKMPDFAGIFGGRGAPGAQGAPPTGGPPPGMPPGMIPGGRGGGPPDLAQMLEMTPPATLDDLKPGQTIVVSSTKSSTPDSLTAIMLVANADMLVRMVSAQIPGTTGGRGNQGQSEMNGMLGPNGFELPGVIP